MLLCRETRGEMGSLNAFTSALVTIEIYGVSGFDLGSPKSGGDASLCVAQVGASGYGRVRVWEG